MNGEFEIHIGLPASVGGSHEIRQLGWKSVGWSLHGRQARDVYPGHRVDGELAAIGTARFSGAEHASQFLAGIGALTWPSGARLEIEILLAEPDLVAAAPERASLLAAVPANWSRVTAPRFEGHAKLPRELVSGDDVTKLLARVPFFELTYFARRRQIVVTFTGESMEDVADAQGRLAVAVAEAGYGPAQATNEEVLGVWQPTAMGEKAHA